MGSSYGYQVVIFPFSNPLNDSVFSICSLWYLLTFELQPVLHDWKSPVSHGLRLSHAVAWREPRGANLPRCVFLMHSSVSLVPFLVS